MQLIETPPHAHLRPPHWNGRIVLGKFVLTLSLDRRLKRERQPDPIVNCLAKLRLERRLERSELAGLLHIHPATLTALEEGSYLPSLRLALELSMFFCQPVEALFSTDFAERLDRAQELPCI